MSKRMKLTREEAAKIQTDRAYASMLNFLLNERRKIDRKIKRCQSKINERHREEKTP